jgi:hypothetical protein
MKISEKNDITPKDWKSFIACMDDLSLPLPMPAPISEPEPLVNEVRASQIEEEKDDHR